MALRYNALNRLVPDDFWGGAEGVGAQGSGFRVQGLGFRVQGLGLRVDG